MVQVEIQILLLFLGVGRGFEIRQRIPSEGSFPGKPGGEYWRTNSREPQTPVSEEEAWSLTAGNKPWTGKKGSAGLNIAFNLYHV